MRKISAMALAGFFLLAPFISAHGGVEKNAGGTTIVLQQTPLSPLVGEKVQMAFEFVTLKDLTPIPNLPVHLKLSDTYRGDESKDVVIAEADLKTDNNGAIEYDYTFNKENYFDVELNFTDSVTNQSQETGFLIQPRAAVTKQNYKTSFLWGLAGLLLGAGLYRLSLKTTFDKYH